MVIDKEMLAAIGGMLDEKLKPIEQQFEVLDQRLDAIERHLEVVDQRLDGMERHLEVVDQRLDTIEQHLEVVDQRLEVVDRKFEAIDQRFEAIDQKLEAIDQRFEAIHQNLRVVENSVLEQVDHVQEIMEKRIDKVVFNMDEMKQYYRIKKLEDENSTLILQIVIELKKEVDVLKQKIA